MEHDGKTAATFDVSYKSSFIIKLNISWCRKCRRCSSYGRALALHARGTGSIPCISILCNFLTFNLYFHEE